MTTTKHPSPSATLAAAAITAAATAVRAADEASLHSLVARLKSKTDAERADAIGRAPQLGAAAVGPIAALMREPEIEVTRAGKRALYRIVRHAGRPGAASEAQAVETALLRELGDDRPVNSRREILWMLSEIGGEEAVNSIAMLLKHEQLREDARCVLQRIPDESALAALKAAHAAASDDFKGHLAESLGKRGLPVPGYQSPKLKPVKLTTVKPPQA